MRRIDEVLDELKKFSSDILTLNPPVDQRLINYFEKKFNVELPDDYKYLLSKTNGLDLMGNTILGINDNEYDLTNVYQFEHFEVMYPQYNYLIPFYPDGRGNFYCFDTSKKTNDDYSTEIVFWTSNYEYTELDVPEITHNCLADFIQECIIEWTLEDYNYDGSQK